MRFIASVVGVVFTLLGLLWILQGTNIISSGFMAGQMQFAVLGAIILVIGLGLLAFVNRRRPAAPPTPRP